MLEIDRWLKWQPSTKKLDDFPGCEPSKPAEPNFEGFGGSVPEETQNFSAHVVAVSNALRENFARWFDSACACSPRCFGGVSRLHIAFCEWEAQRGGVPSTRETFERLLTERGFFIGEAAGVVLVSGLTFREDFEVYR